MLLPSHCDMRGNEVTNDVAELGRSRNPLNVTHTDRMQCRAEILNETPLPGRQRPCSGSAATPAQPDFDADFYIDVDLGADSGIWGTPMPPNDQDFILTVDEPEEELPVARRLFL